MQCTIEINMDNAAFEDAPADELAAILRRLADRVEGRGVDELSLKVMDTNGNDVGRLEVEGAENASI